MHRFVQGRRCFLTIPGVIDDMMVFLWQTADLFPCDYMIVVGVDDSVLDYY